ncbi:hypothetical protein, partial [Rhizobium leguminosarum]
DHGDSAGRRGAVSKPGDDNGTDRIHQAPLNLFIAQKRKSNPLLEFTPNEWGDESSKPSRAGCPDAMSFLFVARFQCQTYGFPLIHSPIDLTRLFRLPLGLCHPTLDSEDRTPTWRRAIK